MEESLPPPVDTDQAEPAEASVLASPLPEPPQLASAMKTKHRPLWQSPDFMKFWVGQSVSMLGDQFMVLALPLLLLQLTPSPLALGIFTVVDYVPYLLLGLPAGALIDRLPRRSVMIICDIIRTLDLVLLAILVMTHVFSQTLTLGVIYVAVVIFSVAQIFFDVAYLSALPNLVEPEQLLVGNSYLQASNSTSQLAARPLAGVVFQVLGAGFALLVDGLSFVVSVISLALIPRSFRKAPDMAKGTAPAARRSLRQEIGEGLRFVWNEPALRWLTILLAVFNSTPAYYLGLFRMREQLHFSGLIIGIILASGAIGGIAGSFVTQRIRRWLGLVPTILLGVILWSLLSITYALSLPPWAFIVAQMISGIALVAIQISIFTLRQAITPDQLMGRVQSVSRLVAWSLIPIGTFVGTALAVPLGASAVIIGAAMMGTLVAAAMFFSPLRNAGGELAV